MTTETTTQAEAWADAHGYTDGQTWFSPEGEHLQTALDADSPGRRTHRWANGWAYEWPDGSVLWAEGYTWQTDTSLDAVIEASCAYCGGAYAPLRDYLDGQQAGVPDAAADAAWAARAVRHARDCEWVETRAHSREPGRWIADARSRLGYTLDQMADRLDVDRKTYSRWEQGHVHPAHPGMLRLALARLEEETAQNG